MNRRLFALAIASAAALPALAATAGAAERPQPRIVVVGEGEATVAPDMAMLSLTVMREAKTAREALDANNDAMAAVIAAMKSSGIEDRDLQTSSIQINPRYNYTSKQDGTQEAELVAYQVSNTLSVRVRELARAGEILDKSVSLGVNQGGGISFLNEDPKPTVEQARRRAVEDGMAKARTLAEAAGVKLGPVVEISETSNGPQPIQIEAKAFRDAAAAAPVEAGENSYRVQVNLTFELH